MNIETAKKTDLAAFLDKIGYSPTRISGNDYWYLSPLRNEKTASFKIDRSKNVFYDHGSGEGGNIIDFVVRYHRCTVKQALQKIKEVASGRSLSFQPPKIELPEKSTPGKIKVISAGDITDQTLLNYLNSRKIPLSIASKYCQQVGFELNNKKQLAIGFKNENGGYELRSYYFKGSSTPKEPKLIVEKEGKDLAVFEGFFSFLSFKAMQEKLGVQPSGILVLNSVAFFEKSRELMERHDNIHLFLDNDVTGKHCTAKALKWSSKYKDESHRYSKHKDLNEYLIKGEQPGIKQSRGRGMTR